MATENGPTQNGPTENGATGDGATGDGAVRRTSSWRSVLVLLAIPTAAFLVGGLVFAVVEVVFAVGWRDGDLAASRFRFTVDEAARLEPDWPMHTASAVGIALCVAIVVVVGHRLGRWAGRPLRRPAAAPLLVAAGAAPIWLGVSAGALRFRAVDGRPGPFYLAGIVVWIVAATLVWWWITRRGLDRHLIVPAAVLATWLAVTAAGVRPAQALEVGPGTAPWWFPLSVLAPDGWAGPAAPVPPLAALSSQLFDGALLALLATCALVAFGAGLPSRVRPSGRDVAGPVQPFPRTAVPEDVGGRVAAFSAWIDAVPANAVRDPEAALWARVGKIQEEAGEVAAALIGVTGQNPRKGVTADWAALDAELLDVAVTALAAWEHRNGNAGGCGKALAGHIDALMIRAGLPLRPAEPGASGREAS